MIQAYQSFVVSSIWKMSRGTNQPIYVMVDDTISEKTKPSSKVHRPIEKCSFHYSHLKGKNVYGHQILVVLVSCNGVVLPYSIHVYKKESMSKIDMTKKIIATLLKPENKGYILCDNWYSCRAVFDASEKAGYGFIGALKTNRVIYPKGHEGLGVKLHSFAKNLTKEDFDLVTVKENDYYIYRYVGHLKDRKNVAILLSYPKESFHEEGTLKAFISLDYSLKPFNILTHYTKRWAIEPFFRDGKTYLWLDGYQVRSKKSIMRYLQIILISYTYCQLYSGEAHHFTVGYKAAKKD